MSKFDSSHTNSVLRKRETKIQKFASSSDSREFLSEDPGHSGFDGDPETRVPGIADFTSPFIGSADQRKMFRKLWEAGEEDINQIAADNSDHSFSHSRNQQLEAAGSAPDQTEEDEDSTPGRGERVDCFIVSRSIMVRWSVNSACN